MNNQNPNREKNPHHPQDREQQTPREKERNPNVPNRINPDDERDTRLQDNTDQD